MLISHTKYLFKSSDMISFEVIFENVFRLANEESS